MDTQIAFDTQGHRGCRGLMPENTWPAMRKALDLGVTTLEMDVVITNDKQVVVSHEQWFNKDITTKPDGTYLQPGEDRRYNIYKMDYDEVRRFDVGMKPYPRFPQQQKIPAIKPRLSDLLDSIAEYMQTAKRPLPLFNIETKSDPGLDGIFQPAPAEFVDLLVQVIRSKGIQSRVTIQSFDPRTLQYLHATYPGFATSLLIDDKDDRTLDQQLQQLGFIPNIYSPAYQLVNPSLLKACHEKKMRVIPWTVNEKATMESLRKMGVDGLISDYPNLY